jgi:ABC-2 type transport system permease protein
VFWWSLALAGLVILTVAFWPAFRGSSGISQAIDSLPPVVIDAFGLQDFGTPAGFLRGNLYELFVPLLFIIATVALVNGQTASDESAGRLELYLAQPVSRRTLFVARVLACFTASAVIVMVTLVAQLIADGIFGLAIPNDLIVGAVTVSGLLAVLYGSLAYALACVWARPSIVLGIAVGSAIAGYVVQALFGIVSALNGWRVFSPWSWAMGGDPLVNGLEPWRIAILIATAVLLLLAGTLYVTRRDVLSG